MATIQQLAPQTGAVTTAIPFDAAAYPYVTLSADNLATTETVTITQAITPAGGTTVYVPTVNVEGAVAGPLTASLPACNLPGGFVYAFTKTTTAGLCGVYLTPSVSAFVGSGTAVATVSGVTSPDGYGAIGNGTTDDTVAVQDAFATGLNVALTEGKTYLVTGPLTMSAGQTLLGNGATIKRAAQVTTTTTTGITTGVTNSITVAAGTGKNFIAGQTISIFNGANYGTQNITIASIAGDVITTTTAFVLSAGSPWSGTTTVAVASWTILTADNCTVQGLVIDGNRSNWTLYHWEITGEIHLAGNNVTIRDCYLHDLPGEGIMEGGNTPYGNTGRKIVNNRIINANGNGIHLSASSGTLIDGNTITDCTLDAIMGHVGGAITFSDGMEKVTVSNNYLARSRCGCGQISSSDNRKISILNNTFDGIALTANMTTNSITTSYAIECASTAKDSAANDITIIGNSLYNSTGIYCVATYTASTAKTVTGITKVANAVVSSTAHGLLVGAVVRFAGVVGMVEINGLYGTVLSVNTNDFTIDINTTGFTTYGSAGTATGTYPQRYVVNDNKLYNTFTPTASNYAIDFSSLYGFTANGNTIHFLGNDVTGNGIGATACTDGVISGNQIKYGITGVSVGTSVNVNVSNNECANGYTYGILYAGTTNCSINNNTISNDTTANAGSYQGIALAGAGASCKGNMLNIVQGYMGIRINAVANCVVQGNTVRAPSTKCIKIETSSSGYVVVDNQVTSAVVDTPAVGVRVANNDTIV
jgi:parallel beta-helix repeat protein